jgi:2'-5' RNA ligase
LTAIKGWPTELARALAPADDPRQWSPGSRVSRRRGLSASMFAAHSTGHSPAEVAVARTVAPPTLRLFIALWPGERTRSALAAWLDKVAWPPGARRMASAKLHLTLHFIGALPAPQLQALKAALPAPSAGFVLRFNRVELWHRGLLVLCPASVPGPLQELHARLAQVLHGLGVPVETRALRPHVTLARDWWRSPAPAQPIELSWPVRSHVLVQSATDGRYDVLKRYLVGDASVQRRSEVRVHGVPGRGKRRAEGDRDGDKIFVMRAPSGDRRA